MRVVLSAELESFRDDVRSWILDHRVPAFAVLDGPEHRAALYNLNYGAWTGGSGDVADGWKEWQRRNTEAGFMCPHWPADVGGRAWDALRLAIWNEELAAAGMPRANRGLGEHLVGPAVIVHGTAEQKAEILPRVIAGDDMYAQGFSEPGAGSDLASLRTTGRIDGESIVLNGQKIWTSLGHLANRMFLLCRTDPAAPKHRGLSYVIIDLDGPGIEMRATRNITGSDDFTEEYLTDARAPLGNVIGGVGNGWRVAMTVLGYERGQMATVQHLGIQRRFWQIVDVARARGGLDDPTMRRRLMRAHARIESTRITGLRILAGTAFERDIERVSSAGKIFHSELEQALAEIAFDVLGPRAIVRPDGLGYELDPWQHELLHSRCYSIQGGTNEVQRNILGERVLGLPKEPTPAMLS